METSLYFIADVSEITRSALIRAKSEIRDSVIPSAKYSCAGSRETLRSGSTAMARITSRGGSGSAPVGAPSRIPRNTCATCAADVGRCAGSLRRHSPTSRSRASGA
ncbi:MAG TPA: hypothetical protein VLJ83_07300, partial [Gemmatimonadaceae bacterium]|nr:hypothetical protein [Gemmatimonadaceae bacterium]